MRLSVLWLCDKNSKQQIRQQNKSPEPVPPVIDEDVDEVGWNGVIRNVTSGLR